MLRRSLISLMAAICLLFPVYSAESGVGADTDGVLPRIYTEEEQELLRYFYCNVVDRSFEAKILEKYDRLTPYNWAVLTLKAMGKTKKEAAHILDEDYGALRTMLHSIVEKKARNDNEAV